MPTIPTTTFEFDGAKITVEQETGWSLPDCQIVCNKLIAAGAYNPTSERQRNRAVRFAEAVVQTVNVVGELGFEFPTPDSSSECLAEAFVEFGQRKGLMTAFYSALQKVEDLTPGEPELKKIVPPGLPEEPTSESQ